MARYFMNRSSKNPKRSCYPRLAHIIREPLGPVNYFTFPPRAMERTATTMITARLLVAMVKVVDVTRASTFLLQVERPSMHHSAERLRFRDVEVMDGGRISRRMALTLFVKAVQRQH